MMVGVVVVAIVVAVSATVKLKSFPSENVFFALVGLVFVVVFNNS